MKSETKSANPPPEQASRDSERREASARIARLAAEREREQGRLEGELSFALGDITELTGQSQALRRVADLIAKSFGDFCVLHVGDGGSQRWISAHADPAKVAWAEELSERWPPQPDSPGGSFAVMRSGQPQWIPEVTDEMLVQSARQPEHLALLRKLGIISYVCAPMRARQRVVGALTCIRAEPSQLYDAADVAFAQRIADRIGLAIDNARLYREAREARDTAERLYVAERKARAEAEALARVAEALSEAQLDLEKVVQRVTDEATALVGAQFGAFFYNVVGVQGEEYMLYTLCGAPRAAFEKFGLPRNTPIFAPTFAGQGIVRLDDVKQDPRYGTLAPHHGMPKGHLPVTSYLAVPVISRTGPVIGGLFFGHPEPGRFTDQHERIAKALASHAAVAIDNARLFKQARDGEERQGRLVAELERAVRFSETFVSILGHDLRNPLSAITTAASVVLGRAESERLAKPLHRILRSADRMSRMIDQILDFARVRLGGGILLQRKPLALERVCQRVLAELENDGHDLHDTQLEVHGSSDGIWDEERLVQLVANLVGNARRHRKLGTPVLLSIDGARPETVTLTVDNIGSVPLELVSVIFEPVRGLESGKREGSSGLGLGLYISQQIARAHGGSLRLDSGPGRDHTRFAVELPRTPPRAQTALRADPEQKDVS
jgi:signal transduction histidine kinase